MAIDYGNIVATYSFPTCTVRISNVAFVGRTEDDLKEIRQSDRRIAWDIIERAYERGEEI